MTSWKLPGHSLTTSWWFLDDWQLFDDCLMTTWQLPEDSLTTICWLPDSFLDIRWQVPDYCQMTAWQLTDDCVTTAWQKLKVADFAFQSWIFDNRTNSKEHHWKNTSSQSSQEQTYRTEKARFCEYSQVTSVEFNRECHSTYSCKIFCSYEKVNSVRFVK